MPDKKAERPEGQMRRRPMRRRKKVCAFCADARSLVAEEKRFAYSAETRMALLIIRMLIS